MPVTNSLPPSYSLSSHLSAEAKKDHLSQAEECKQIQKWLNMLGYSCPITGKPDDATGVALRKFQAGEARSAVSRTNDVVNDLRWEAARALLRGQNYDCPASAPGDEVTRQALMKFQKSAGLLPDGIPSERTMMVLEKAPSKGWIK